MTPSGSAPSVRLDRLAFGSALFFALVAAAPLFAQAGFLATRGIGDSPSLLLRVQQLLATLSSGEFPARWMPDAAYGYGFPQFSYYASFSIYVAAALKLYGFPVVMALKLAQGLALMVASGGMYAWARTVSLARRQSVLAAAAYTFAPFHLVNLYTRGDSLAELWAMALFPVAFWAAQRALERASFGRTLMLALTTATLICMHNISALNFMPFLSLYVALAKWVQFRRAGGQPVLAGGLALAWGLALSAFFWLPALGEGRFVQLGDLTSGFFFYGNHFRGTDLVQGSWLADYQTHPFSMGLVQTLLAGAGLGVLLWRAWRQRQWSWLNTFAVMGAGISTLMITPLSKPLWDTLPLLPYTQFPWRFLSIQALFTALLSAFAVDDGRRTADDGRIPSFVHRLSSAVIALALAVSALASLRLDFIPLTNADITAERLNLYEYFSAAIGSTVNSEYLPREVQPRPFTSDAMLGRAPRLKVFSGTAAGERLWKRGSTEQWSIANTEETPATVAVPTHYWPGWQAEADGAPLAVHPADGLGWIAFDLPPGTHTVTLRLGRTPLRLGAELLSLLALLLPLAIGLYYIARGEHRLNFAFLRRHRWTVAGALGVLLLGFGILQVLPEPPATPLPLSMDYETLPYAHHDVVRFSDGTELRNVQYNADHLRRGETLTVTTQWQPARSGQAHFRLAPAPAYPALPLPGASIFVDGALTPETPLTVALTIPTDIPPGVYFVAVEFSDKQTTYPAVTSTGRPRGLVHLAPVWVDDDGMADTEPVAPPLADFGPVRLVAATVSYDAGDLQAARLLWQAIGDVPRNYAIALRVRDAAGNEWGDGGDMQIAFGFYPTSMWRVGEQVPDYYQVRLNGPGEPPGDYHLSVTMYDVGTLQPLGEARVPFTLNRRHPRAGRAAQFALIPNLELERVGFPTQASQSDHLLISATWLTGPQPNPLYRARWTLSPLEDPSAPAYTRVLDLAPSSPTDRWPLDSYLIGRVRLPLPSDLVPGTYALAVQLVDEAEEAVGAAAEVGTVEVTGRVRDFTVPPYQTEVGATFDGQLKLWGYDSARTEAELRLTLVWGALAQPRSDYKFFVHLFNTADGFVAAQADAVPRSFTYPTTLWAKDEVVTDTVALNLAGLASGDYGLAVGWYDPNTPDLARLPAFDAQGQRLELDRVVLPFELSAP